MAGLERSAKRTARYAGKTIRSARKTAVEGHAAANAVARQVVGAIGNAKPKTRKGRIALAIGLTAAAIILRKKAAAARRAALA